MKKQILSIIIVLALTIGAATVAVATDTNGSIDFESKGIIIKEPNPDDCNCCPKCCECSGKCGDGCEEDHEDGDCDCDCDCDCPCECICEEIDYDNFFIKLKVDNNLYFGSHELTTYGTFDSANKAGSPQEGEERFTGIDGKFTGVEIINKSAAEAIIGVEITEFTVDSAPTLDGAELTLMDEAAIVLGGVKEDEEVYTQNQVVLLPGEASSSILYVNSGRAVKAAWYGILLTEPGTAIPGKAQATLTWTDKTNLP